MIVSDLMDELATQLETISGLRCFAYPPDSLTPPAAVVSYPDVINYDATYGRGSDTLTLPVMVLVGRPTDRTARDLLSAYVDGSGSKSVKAVLEAGTYTAFDSIRVASAEIDVVTIGATPYLNAEFSVEITGSGS